MPRKDLIQLRGGTAAQWTSVNPILEKNEPGYEEDTGKQKIGDGTTAWNALAYTSGDGGAGTVTSVNGVDPDGSGNVALTKSDIGLGNVDNTADADKPVSTAQGTAITTAENNAKAYADGLVVNLWDDRGSFDASGGAYPSTGGSGSAGAIKRGDVWTISVAGTLPTGQAVEVGDLVRALIDTPGNTQANWAITQNNIGYTAENTANKNQNNGYAGLDSSGNVTKIWTTVLTGLTAGTNAVIAATDTVLAAFAKLQAQITAALAAIPVAADQTETDAGSLTTKWINPARLFGKFKAKTSTSSSFTVDSTNDLKTIIATPSGSINATINSAATDVIVSVMNYGTGTITFVNGTATFSGISSLLPNKGALIRYTASGTAVIVGGSSITFANVTAKPTTVAGYGITDASRAIFAVGATVNSVGTTETTLATGNIPANTLSSDLGHIRSVFVGQFAASANNKTLKVKLGATTIFDSGAMPATGAIDFEIQIKIMRTGSAAQRGSVTLYSNSGVVASVKYFTATEDFTTTLALAVTGTVASPGGTEISGNIFYAVKEGI